MSDQSGFAVPAQMLYSQPRGPSPRPKADVAQGGCPISPYMKGRGRFKILFPSNRS